MLETEPFRPFYYKNLYSKVFTKYLLSAMGEIKKTTTHNTHFKIVPC